MAVARHNGETIAKSDDYEVVEGNVYFPPGSVNDAYLEPSEKTTTCPWKGKASYYDVVIGDDRLDNAAWYYPNPKDEATQITDHVAFYTDSITVKEEP